MFRVWKRNIEKLKKKNIKVWIWFFFFRSLLTILVTYERRDWNLRGILDFLSSHTWGELALGMKNLFFALKGLGLKVTGRMSAVAQDLALTRKENSFFFSFEKSWLLADAPCFKLTERFTIKIILIYVKFHRERHWNKDHFRM